MRLVKLLEHVLQRSANDRQDCGAWGGWGGRHQGLGVSEEGLDILGKNTGINEQNIGSSPLDQLVKGNERVRVHVKNHVHSTPYIIYTASMILHQQALCSSTTSKMRT